METATSPGDVKMKREQQMETQKHSDGKSRPGMIITEIDTGRNTNHVIHIYGRGRGTETVRIQVTAPVDIALPVIVAGHYVGSDSQTSSTPGPHKRSELDRNHIREFHPFVRREL